LFFELYVDHRELNQSILLHIHICIMDLQGGEYLLSFGVTGYEEDTFTVYHRLYDILNITVISDKNTVGFYDMNSAVEVKER
ncbi:MAG: Wzt carbohydrate-binding domain-containing protein, partial [Lachnospiraceae bacterium]|nr:Wzt carbohydrate-binding domain-containing protein [Lachnospiraceae bacterium]